MYSLDNICPYLSTIKNKVFRYLSSKIAGVFIPKGKNVLRKTFELLMLGLELQVSLSLRQKGQKGVFGMRGQKVMIRSRGGLVSSVQREFSFVQEGKLDEKLFMLSGSQAVGVERTSRYQDGQKIPVLRVEVD